MPAKKTTTQSSLSRPAGTKLRWLLAAVLSGLIGSYLLVFGHADPTGPLKTTTSLPRPDSCQDGSVSYNGVVYCAFVGNQVQVFYARVAADGSLGGWQSAAAATPNCADGDLQIQGAFLYAVCLDAYTSSAADVYYASITSTGSLGPWQSGGSFMLSKQVSDLVEASVISNGYLYVMENQTVHYAHIADGGSLGIWQTTTPLPAYRDNAALVASDGYLYIVGGYYALGQGNITNTVYLGRVNIDGTVSSWGTTTPLPQTRVNMRAVATGGVLYVAGGESYDHGAVVGGTDTIYYASLSGNGLLGPWKVANLPQPLFGSAVTAVNGMLYVLGGGHWNKGSYTGSTTVYYVGIGGKGSGSNGSGSGTGLSGTGTGNNPAGAKGFNGAGAASTSSQAASSNPTTTSSPQGTTTKQPDSQPNPFYDGKQYAPGSEQDIAIRTAAARHRRMYGWLLAAGLLVLAIVIAVVVWYRRRHRRPRPSKAVSGRRS